VIRRAFWLGAGAAAGIMGYRRVEAIGRKVTGRVPGTVTGASTRKVGKHTALRLARESMRFTRDVREGMELYTARHNRAEASTLSTRSTQNTRSTQSARSTRRAPTPIAKDGR
jgi:hypothetical protein